MKKLILLLLPALLLTACDKEKKEPESTTRAKALADTYTYTRVGQIKDGVNRNIQINMNVSGTATITHTGGSNFTMTLTHDTTNIILDGHVNGDNSLVLYPIDSAGRHTTNYKDYYAFKYNDRNDPENSGDAIAQFQVSIEEIIYDDLTILLREEYYNSTFYLPSHTYPYGCGTGLLTLSRQK